jgi:hypothetical protein
MKGHKEESNAPPIYRKHHNPPTENDNCRKASINGIDSMSPEGQKGINYYFHMKLQDQKNYQ